MFFYPSAISFDDIARFALDEPEKLRDVLGTAEQQAGGCRRDAARATVAAAREAPALPSAAPRAVII